MPDGNGQEDGILTLPYIEFVIGEQSAATAGPLPTVVVDTATTTTTPTPTPTPVANTTGDVTLATVTQRIESAVERERSTSVSDDGSVFEEFTYRFSSLSGPAELYVVSRDNTLSATVYQGSSQNGPFTATQTSSSAAGITNADIARIYQINQLNDGKGVEHPGSLERKSYPNNIDSGTFLEDQFKITWTHDPAAGQFVKIRIYKGKKRGGLFGGQGRTGTYGYFLQYPTDTVTTEVRTVSNPNTFEYTGVVHSVNPNSFTITNSMNYYFDFYAVGDYFYLADSQKFVISMSGLKPNTNHTFTFDGEDRTSKCSQIRTSTTNSSGLRSDENGILTFDFYYDAGLDEAATDIEAQNRIIANIAGQKRFVVENNDGTSRAAGQITLAYYSNIIPNNADYLNVTPSTTSTSVTEQESFIPSTSGGSGTPDVIDTSVDPAGTYNVQRLDFRNFESQINFRIP
jgi:hypothetical protein